MGYKVTAPQTLRDGEIMHGHIGTFSPTLRYGFKIAWPSCTFAQSIRYTDFLIGTKCVYTNNNEKYLTLNHGSLIVIIVNLSPRLGSESQY